MREKSRRELTSLRSRAALREIRDRLVSWDLVKVCGLASMSSQGPRIKVNGVRSSWETELKNWVEKRIYFWCVTRMQWCRARTYSGFGFVDHSECFGALDFFLVGSDCSYARRSLTTQQLYKRAINNGSQYPLVLPIQSPKIVHDTNL